MNSNFPYNNKKHATAFAKAYNNLSIIYIEGLLSDDFSYASQWVLSELSGKKAFLDYLEPKFQTISDSGTKVMARLAVYRNDYCVVISQVAAQQQAPTDGAVLLLKVENDKIKRADLCMVPSISEVVLLDSYPS